LSWEKNLPAFLDLDLPGTKVVYGAGPLATSLAQRYPDVVWRGVVPRSELARIYSAADAFVFPGRSETFGLVMLEALACGTPVAAFPVAGPADVLGDSDAGVLSEDLKAAALAALHIPAERALARAHSFDWSAVVTQFLGLLVDARASTVTESSRIVHKLGS
jgi:glycosyltransferase involved in cell wall biosynthesis